MLQAEPARQGNGSWPKSNSLLECKLRVAAKREFLIQPNDQKNDTPDQGPFEDGAPLQLECAEVVVTKRGQCAQNGANFRDAKDGALHEVLGGVSPEGQPILAEIPALQD